MTEPQLRALFKEMADESAVSQVDPQLGRRRARLRWRQAGVAGASAVATAVVIIASLAISSVVQQRPTGPGPAASAVIAKVPPYFVALTGDALERHQVGLATGAVVGATATGAVQGTVAPPKQYPLFTTVTGAGDGRTFIFAAARGPNGGPVRFYRLVLSKSGHPGRLTPLPLPPETGSISGLAVSPDGNKLAVSVSRPGNPRVGAKIQVFSLATGAEREWVWPGKGWIGWSISLGVNESAARALSWAADNRSLLFEEQGDSHGSRNAQARLLDTAAPGGSLLASSTLVPIPSVELVGTVNAPFKITGSPLLTGDGTKIVAPTTRNFTHGPAMLESAITVFSVRTGKPLQVLHRQKLKYDNGASVLWVNHSGTAMIAGHPLPKPASPFLDSVIGVQTPARFVPLPPGVQHYFRTGAPDW